MSVIVPDPCLNIPYAVDLRRAAAHRHNLTVRPSVLDPRDWTSTLAVAPVFPPSFTLPACYDPLDQGQLGSCTANGMAGMYATELLLAGKPPTLISRLALYYMERLAENSVNEDSGAMPRDGLVVMKKSGVGEERFWPYDITKFTQSPPAEEVADAPNHKIGAFFRVSGTLGVKNALLHKHPVGIAMLVFDGMERSRNGVIPMPERGAQPLGGHWLYIRGWQDFIGWPGGGYFILRNSWSAQAGIGGDYLLPYAYAANSGLVSEFWYVRLAATAKLAVG